MKKRLKSGYIFLFVLLCVIPVFMMPLFGQSETSEKRQLMEKPILWGEDGWNMDFTEEYEMWIRDHFSFRSQFVTAGSWIKSCCFASSSQEQVIIGKEGWLFFSETINDYAKQSTLSDREVERIIKILELMEEYVNKKGGRFLFFAAPNKNTIYPEYMPYYYRQGTKKSALEQLNEQLAGEAFYVNLVPVLKDAAHGAASLGSAEENTDISTIYHRRDTHWNNYGAAVSYDVLMDRLEKEHRDWLSMDHHVEESWNGDLEQILFPVGGRMDEQVLWDYETHFTYESTFRSAEDFTIATANPYQEGSLLMFRDSFGNALYPFFAEEYGNAVFSKVVPYRLYSLEEEPYEDVVIELAERNIAQLLENAPMMPAPLREAESGRKLQDVVVYRRQIKGMLHVYGIISEPVSGDIYVAVTDEGVTKYYEAFPVLEKELLTGDAVSCESQEGFSCYLPYEDSNERTIEVVVL